jgi:hypothetical protein
VKPIKGFAVQKIRIILEVSATLITITGVDRNGSIAFGAFHGLSQEVPYLLTSTGTLDSPR